MDCQICSDKERELLETQLRIANRKLIEWDKVGEQIEVLDRHLHFDSTAWDHFQSLRDVSSTFDRLKLKSAALEERIAELENAVVEAGLADNLVLIILRERAKQGDFAARIALAKCQEAREANSDKSK